MKCKNRLILSLIIGVVLFLSFPLLAQESNLFNGTKYRIGLVYGNGNQNQLDVDYDYRINLFQAQLYYALIRKPNKGIDILVQPQYNVTRFRRSNTDTDETNGFEFGINAGVLARWNFFEDFLSFYALISAGPHYISGAPARQASGFIFSDNFNIGLNLRLHEAIYLDLRYGFQHLSNAGFKRPNGGINSLILGGGLLINIANTK